MKKILLLSFLFFTSLVFSQQEASNWYFGQNAGIKFHPDGSVTTLSDGKLITNEGCSSISDQNGTILFYSDGRSVWDKNHIIMPNGNYFAGTGLQGDPSSTQSVIIVPKPGNVNIYYIFTLDEPHQENAAVYPNAFSGNYQDSDSGKTPDNDDGLNKGLNYSIVDLSVTGSNGSIGDIIIRNNHLITYDTNPIGEEIKYKCSEKLTAVKDATGNGYWVITQFTSNFYAFQVSASGVNSTPVKSAALPNVPVLGYRRNAVGYLKASPNGTRLAAAYLQIDSATSSTGIYNGAVYLYDFNAMTGIVSNSRLLLPDVQAYGVEFSNNSNILYSNGRSISSGFELSQFDLLSAAIPQSKTVISSSYRNGGALQLGPNKKIYYCTDKSDSVGVINNPDVLGLGCNYDNEGQLLATNTYSIYGLPPFITSFFDVVFEVKKLCFGALTEFTLNSYQSVTSAVWSFGDGTTATGVNPTHTYSNAGTYTVSVSVNGDTPKTKIITISSLPTATKPSDLLICDSNNDGLFNFDLTTQNTAILNGQDPNLYAVTYFANATDYANKKAIVTPNNYVNALPYQLQTIIAEVSNKANGSCKSASSFDIDVFDSPKPSTVIPKISSCDNTSFGTDADDRILFDLTQRATTILNGQSASQFVLSYYKDSTLSQLILSPNAYANTNTSETIYVKMTNKDNATCFATTSFPIEVLALPVITSTVSLKQCDDDIDGFSVFNLEEAIGKITANAANETIVFYKTLADAQNDTTPITNPTTYTNQVVSNDAVYTRVSNFNGCFRIAKVNLFVSTTQIPLNYSKSITECDDAILGTNTDGIASFNFSSVTAEIENIFPVGQLLDIRYFRNLADALAEKNAITDISNYRNIGYPNSQKIYIRVDSQVNNDCLGLGNHITLNVERIPIVKPIIEIHCDDDQDEKFAFDTTNLQSQLLNGLTNVSVAYFDQNNVLLSTPLPNPFVTATQKLKVIVTNTTSTACSYESSIDFVVDDLPEAFAVPSNLTSICDDEADPSLQDGKFAFDTTTFLDIILGGQTGMKAKYFDASNNFLFNSLPNPFETATQSIKVEVINPKNTTCTATVTLSFVVNPVPKIALTGDELVCTDLPTFTKDLDAGLLDGSPSIGYSYIWTFNGNAIVGETNYTLTVNTAGLYTVKVTNNQGCSRTRTFTVVASDKANITDVKIVDLAESNSITVSVATSFGDYVYALDDENGTYQTDTVFTNVSAGIHTVYVKDLNGCGIESREVAVLGIPNFFTPNNDGNNDYWNIKGANASFNTNTIIYIFDRYGKLVKQISPQTQGWDGTFTGQPMPASDYWYSIQLEDGRVFKGHFSLKR